MSEIAIISTREVIYEPSLQKQGKIKVTLSLQKISSNWIFYIKYFGLETRNIVVSINEKTQEETKEDRIFETVLFETSFTKSNDDFKALISALEIINNDNILDSFNEILEKVLRDFVTKDFVSENILRFGLITEDY